jgi:hypothetical protein
MENLRQHSWSDGATPHEILQDGQIILHHRCLKCGRDFAKEEVTNSGVLLTSDS